MPFVPPMRPLIAHSGQLFQNLTVFSGVSAVITAVSGLPGFPAALPFFMAAIAINFATMVLSLATSAYPRALPSPILSRKRRRRLGYDGYQSGPARLLWVPTWIMGCLAVGLWFAGLYLVCTPSRLFPT